MSTWRRQAFVLASMATNKSVTGAIATALLNSNSTGGTNDSVPAQMLKKEVSKRVK